MHLLRLILKLIKTGKQNHGLYQTIFFSGLINIRVKNGKESITNHSDLSNFKDNLDKRVIISNGYNIGELNWTVRIFKSINFFPRVNHGQTGD